MSTRTPASLDGRRDGRASLTERYVHAATRSLPEDQRADVAEELRASITDRVESLRAERGPSAEEAERMALEELGDPDRLAAGYTGRRLGLIGPELYPQYVRVLKAILVTVVPILTAVIALVEAVDGASVGAIVGRAVWMAFTVALHVAFWVTLTFAIVERSASDRERLERSVGATWSPEQLPDLPRGSRASLGEACTNIVWLGILAAAIVWQQVASPLGDSIPVLDPDLWSFWLPLILALLAAEAVLEIVKYRAGGEWTVRFATVNTVLGAVFAAPVIYLAATDRLLNPAAVAEIQQGWAGFDPGVAHTVILVSALVIWAWDSVEGWRKALG